MERIHHHRDRKLWLAAAAILKPSPRKFIWGTKQKGCIGSKPTRDSGDNDHRKWEQGALEGADQIRAPNKPTLQARPTAGPTYHGEPSPRSDPAAAVNRPPPISRTRAESRRGRGKEGGKGKWRRRGEEISPRVLRPRRRCSSTCSSSPLACGGVRLGWLRGGRARQFLSHLSEVRRLAGGAACVVRAPCAGPRGVTGASSRIPRPGARGEQGGGEGLSRSFRRVGWGRGLWTGCGDGRSGRVG
jgi:hypothetical protein